MKKQPLGKQVPYEDLFKKVLNLWVSSETSSAGFHQIKDFSIPIWGKMVGKDGTIHSIEVLSPRKFYMRDVTPSGLEKIACFKSGRFQWKLEIEGNSKTLSTSKGIISHIEDDEKIIKNAFFGKKHSCTTVDKASGKITKNFSIFEKGRWVRCDANGNIFPKKNLKDVFKKLSAEEKVNPVSLGPSLSDKTKTLKNFSGADRRAYGHPVKNVGIRNNEWMVTKFGSKLLSGLTQAMIIKDGLMTLNDFSKHPEKVMKGIDDIIELAKLSDELKRKVAIALAVDLFKNVQNKTSATVEEVKEGASAAVELYNMPLEQKREFGMAILADGKEKLSEVSGMVKTVTKGVVEDATIFYELPMEDKIEIGKGFLNDAKKIYLDKGHEVVDSSKQIWNHLKSKFKD